MVALTQVRIPVWQILSANPKIKESQGSTSTLYLSVFTVFFLARQEDE